VYFTGRDAYLDLSGTIDGGRRSTDGALMDFRLLDRRTAHDALVGGNNRGYFDLFGYWHGRNSEWTTAENGQNGSVPA
jgi:hypothetical protein